MAGETRLSSCAAPNPLGGASALPRRDVKTSLRGNVVCAAGTSAAEKAAAVLSGSAAELPISAVLDEIVGVLEKSHGLVLQVCCVRGVPDVPAYVLD